MAFHNPEPLLSPCPECPFYPSSLSYSVWLSHLRVIFKQQKFISCSSGSWEVQDQGPWRVSIYWGLLSASRRYLIAISYRVDKCCILSFHAEHTEAFFITGLTPFMKANHLPPLNPTSLGVKFQYMHFGGAHFSNIASTQQPPTHSSRPNEVSSHQKVFPNCPRQLAFPPLWSKDFLFKLFTVLHWNYQLTCPAPNTNSQYPLFILLIPTQVKLWAPSKNFWILSAYFPSNVQ